MSTRAFTDLLPRVLPIVAGCPQPLAIQHIRDAAIRICERTLAWRYVQPTANLLPGVYEYAYSKPPATEVHTVFAAHVNGSPLEVLTLEQALKSYPAWADLYGGVDLATVWTGATAGVNEAALNEVVYNGGGTFTIPDEAMEDAGEPRSILQVVPDKYIVLPMPDNQKTYSLRMFYALRPARNASGMDEVVLNELEDAVVHNALQHLLVIPNVAWTNLDLASYHAKQGLFVTTERRARANLGNMRGTLVAYAPKFA
jgi:hypothetical protein